MESFFLDLGLSWTLSKVLPFVIFIIVGFALFFVVQKSTQVKWIRVLSFALVLLPVLIYFIFNPIYSGDFANGYRLEKLSKASIDITPGRFTILTIPYCSFCEARLDDLEIIKSRVNKNTEIDVLVCTSNTGDLEFYKKKVGKGVNVKMVKDLKAIVALSNAQFPTFVFSDSTSMRVWSNDQFGTRAKDDIEHEL